LGIKLRTYLSRAFILPLALCIPLVAVLLLMQRWFVPHHFSQLCLQLVIAGLVYGITLAWAFWTRRAWDIGRLAANPDDAISLALVETYDEASERHKLVQPAMKQDNADDH
jgi:hypothetical protein